MCLSSSGNQGSYQSLSKLGDDVPDDEQINSPDKSYNLSLPQDESTADPLLIKEPMHGSASSLDELLGKKEKPLKKNNSKKEEKESVNSFKKQKKNDNTKPEDVGINFQSAENKLTGSNIEFKTLDREPRRLDAGKPLVADKWKSEPLLNEPKNEKPKLPAIKKLGSVPDVAVEPVNQTASVRTLEHTQKPKTVEALRAHVFMGHLNVKVPKIARMVRLYVSTTFTGEIPSPYPLPPCVRVLNKVTYC